MKNLNFQTGVLAIMGLGVGFIGISALLTHFPEGLSLSLPETSGLGQLTDGMGILFLTFGLAVFLASKFDVARRLMLIGGGLAIVYSLMYSELPVGLVDWDWGTTPFGERLDEKYGEGASWWLWLPIGLIVWLIFSKGSQPKRKKLGFEASGFDFFLWGIIGLIALTAVGGITSILLATFTDADEAILGTLETPVEMPIQCTEEWQEEQLDKLGNGIVKTIPAAGTTLTLCPQSPVITLWRSPDHSVALEQRFETRFHQENHDVLQHRTLTNFITIKQAGDQGDYYYFGVPKNNHFGQSGLDFVEIYIRPVPSY